MPAGIIGSKLGAADGLKTFRQGDPVTWTATGVRVCCEEINQCDALVPNGRYVVWETKDGEYAPKVGATLQIEQDFKNPHKVVRFRVKVISHEKL